MRLGFAAERYSGVRLTKPGSAALRATFQGDQPGATTRVASFSNLTYWPSKPPLVNKFVACATVKRCGNSATADRIISVLAASSRNRDTECWFRIDAPLQSEGE